MRITFAALAAFFMLTVMAFGQTVDLAPMPITIVPPPTNTVVQVPVGDWFGTALGYLTLWVMGGGAAWLIQRTLGRLSPILLTMQVEQLMTRALVYAINTVVGATRNRVWTVDVRNEVLREIVIYALTHGSEAVKAFMGRPAQIAEMGYSRIDAPTGDVVQKPTMLPDAPKPDFKAIGAAAEHASNIKEARA